MRSMADSLIADWERLGMEGVYHFPEDMLCDSQRRIRYAAEHQIDPLCAPIPIFAVST